MGTHIMLNAGFWERVDRCGHPASCWEWLGSIRPDGYGMYRGRRAHRVSYELMKGEIGQGLTIDHLCRNRSCVNPDHLEPVTGVVNTMRGESPHAKHARQTHCKHGHEFTAENIIRRKGKPKGRECRVCFNARQRETWRQGKRKRGPNG